MYVCLCNGISDRQIREVVDIRGAGTLPEVQCYLPVGNCCGRCEDVAQEIIVGHVESASRPAAA